MNIGKIILFAIAGMFVAIVLHSLADDGYFERWTKKTGGIFNSDFELYASLTSEDSFENPPCDYSSPAFSIISNSPKDIEACVQNIIWYPEGDDHTIYVIDNQGNYWKWSHFSIMNLYNMFWISISGLIAGMSIGFVVDNQTSKPLQENNSKAG